MRRFHAAPVAVLGLALMLAALSVMRNAGLPGHFTHLRAL